MARGEPISVRIVRRVAEREGVDPSSLEPPLQQVIDPDALESLFRRPGGRPAALAGSVEFAYNGHEVVVDSSGDVTVTDLDLEPGSDVGSTGESAGD